jgi:hypothetical protein
MEETLAERRARFLAEFNKPYHCSCGLRFKHKKQLEAHHYDKHSY